MLVRRPTIGYCVHGWFYGSPLLPSSLGLHGTRRHCVLNRLAKEAPERVRSISRVADTGLGAGQCAY